MTENDLEYVKRLIDCGIITGPVLELGAGYRGATCRDVIRQAGIEYFASDITPTAGINFVADFENKDIQRFFPPSVKFNCILVLNVLEHTVDPIRVLDNAIRLLNDLGLLVIIAPAVWALHNYPVDCCRLLPNWFERYAEIKGMVIIREWFEYLGYGRVDRYLDRQGNHQFPPPIRSSFKYWKSRIVQRLFDTYGRGMAFPNHLAIGVVMRLQKRF
ncbi:MAG: hypothetical protein A2156_01715 [Deltaproteobacteria bacterium RBG_16_48_10]|nr:MAG: hypothetical protein A2156_01715 [Deltaproteobacteria bacterium RBG_16_48_10]